MTEVAIMEIKSAAGTFATTSTMVIIRPTQARSTVGEAKLPMPTVVAAEDSPTTMPALTRPIRAMNIPMPAPMAFFRSIGIALTRAVLAPVTVRRIKMRPAIKTADSAAPADRP